MTNFVWVFNGTGSSLPCAVFSSRELAEEWIGREKVSGILTAYPVDESVLDWGIREGRFQPKTQYQKGPRFVQSFTSAGQPHFHYENGDRRG